MNSLKKNWILILAILAVVALVLFNLPRLQAWRLRAMAAEQIMRYVDLLETSSPDAVDGLFYCLLPLFHEEVQPPIALNDAIQWLEESQQLDPHNSHGDFLLGQAYCFAREYSQAIDELYIFVNQRNGNTLGMAELGFAYLSASFSSLDTEQADMELEIARLWLEKAGFGAAFFETTGEKAYKQGNYQDSLAWFNIAEKFAPLSEANGRKLALLRVPFEGSNEISVDLPVIAMGNDPEELIIRPSLFFQINTGQPADVRKTGDDEVAVIWSNSSIIGTLIDVAQPSEYCLSVSAVDQKPEPTQLAVYLNFKKMLDIDLTEGDGQIKEFTVPVELEKGLSLISIKLLNDYYSTTEGDRNGYISAISLAPCLKN